MKLKEEEFIPGFTAKDIAILKTYCKKHNYKINYAERLIMDMEGCHSAYLIKDNTKHICAVQAGIKEDITENILLSSIVMNKLKTVKDNQRNIFKQFACGDVFGLVSLTHSESGV